MNNIVYWSGLEYRYNNSQLTGGFVYAFIAAEDVRDCVDKLLEELTAQNIAPVKIEFVSPYDLEMEWETNKETTRYKELYREAQSNEVVVFDTFYAYENNGQCSLKGSVVK